MLGVLGLTLACLQVPLRTPHPLWCSQECTCITARTLCCPPSTKLGRRAWLGITKVAAAKGVEAPLQAHGQTSTPSLQERLSIPLQRHTQQQEQEQQELSSPPFLWEGHTLVRLMGT